MKISYPIWLLTALLAITASVSGCKPPPQESATGVSAAITANQAAPAWTLKNLEDQDVSFAQYKGKVVVIDFWATWCGPCRMEIPGYIELQKKYGPDGLVIIGIAYNDSKGPVHVKEFAEKNGMNYQIVMGDEAVAEAFGGIEGIPTTFLINREGRIVHRKMGAWDHAKYEALVKQFL